ncbi:MAG TPA: hypothetical protein VIV15_03970 [Anaerolineales bacterium]
MDFAIMYKGLNELLAAIYGPGTQLDTLLHELGFEQAQVAHLHGSALEAVVAGVLESLHERLTGAAGQDTWYQVLSRRYGLDGEPPQSLDEIAQSRGMDREYLGGLWRDVMARCKTQKNQNDLRRDLKQLAVAQLNRSAERPGREAVAAKLERLSSLRSAADLARLDYESKRSEILQKVQGELDALELEYQPILQNVDENIDELENEIKTDVLLHGESVTAGGFRAVYTRGRVTWDNSGIEKYAQAHPEVLEYRKQGAPIVVLRAVGEKD